MIDERYEMLHDIARFLANRADEERGPEIGAVLASVTDFGLAVGATGKRGFDFRHRLRSGAARHQ